MGQSNDALIKLIESTRRKQKDAAAMPSIVPPPPPPQARSGESGPFGGDYGFAFAQGMNSTATGYQGRFVQGLTCSTNSEASNPSDLVSLAKSKRETIAKRMKVVGEEMASLHKEMEDLDVLEEVLMRRKGIPLEESSGTDEIEMTSQSSDSSQSSLSSEDSFD